MTEKIRFSIVGFGNIGRRHAEHIRQNPSTELVAVCDIDASKEALAEGLPFYSNLEEMLSSVQADVLCVCTPNYLHERHTIQGLEAGLHTVVEKPMAISVPECERMIAAAEKTGKTIFAVKQNRYNPPVQAVKKLIVEKQLGEIYMLQVNCFWNRSDAYYSESDWRGKKDKDGGCLFTQFSHFVDILYYLNGKVETVEGWIHNFAHQHNTEVEDTGSFVLRGQNGTIINFNFTTCSYETNMEGSITIFAEKGTVKIGGQYLNTIEYQKLESAKLPEINISAKANNYGLYQGSMSNHDKVVQNVVDVLHYGHAVMTSAAEGCEVVRMIEQMYKGATKV
ncbi:Gfo/Idh/MocA family protein [Polluticoccus soli]|uniref:Gfo/Idh/MocA family protein n=1 Tax=Polluticoccus soli TaxID=3034150 RepID=UPI0023E15E5B|nr:Gfo/Idh/MocA family oxidoreductase [Flavipsychrobacter sp. JY13-12]